MTAIVKFNGEPITFSNEGFLYEDVNTVNTIDIEFDNTGKYIPLFLYSDEELNQIELNKNVPVPENENEIAPDPEIVIPVFPTTQKYFSPKLKEELSKFVNLTEINIISNNVIPDDSFPTNCPVNIIVSKTMHRVVVSNISTPADLFALMQSTNVGEMAGTYTLMNDIDMTGFTCVAIGRAATPFTGSFDGQGFTIRIADISTTLYNGLFGLITTGVLSNISLVYTSATTTLNPISGFNFVGGLFGHINGTGSATECSVVYEGDTILTGPRNGGFGNLENDATVTDCSLTVNGDMTCTGGRSGGAFANLFTNCTLNNFICNIKGGLEITTSLTFNGSGCIGLVSTSSVNNLTCALNDVSINDTSFGNGGCIGLVQSASLVNNITCTINDVSIKGASSNGGCIGAVQSASSVNNIVCNINNISLNGSGIGYGCIFGSVAFGVAQNQINDIIFVCKNINIVGDTSSVFSGFVSTATINNIYIIISGDASFDTTYWGALVGLSNRAPGITDISTINNCNVIFKKNVSITANNAIGGIIGGIIDDTSIDATDCSVFYGSNVEFTAPNIGGIAWINKGSHTRSVVAYNNYAFTGATLNATFVSGNGTATDCFTNTFTTDTTAIPNTNASNILTTLESQSSTAWLSYLLSIRQSLDVGNNSQNLNDIFTLSTNVSNVAKNNALTTSMTFAGVPFINTTPSVIQPLLLKYKEPLPSVIRYTTENDVAEIDISQSASYYIYQNPAYITPANKLITSNTKGDGSINFDTENVPVGSSVKINSLIYNVLGVGSSLIEVSKATNTFSVIFAILAGIILLLVIIFGYLWGWKGYMFLPIIIAIVMAVLAVVYAF